MNTFIVDRFTAVDKLLQNHFIVGTFWLCIGPRDVCYLLKVSEPITFTSMDRTPPNIEGVVWIQLTPDHPESPIHPADDYFPVDYDDEYREITEDQFDCMAKMHLGEAYER